MLIPALAALLGAVLASFAGVISERMHTGEPWTRGRSRCNSCNRFLTALDLIPGISWLVWLGRCRTCKAPVPYRYALAEATLAVLYGASALTLPTGLPLLALLTFLFVLMVLVLYDLRHTVVPSVLSYTTIALAALYAVLAQASLHALGLTVLTAGVIGFAFFLMHALSGGKWMGLGDAPVALALSLVVGREAVAGLLFSFWIGAVIGILVLVAAPRGHRMGIEVPFVPFLAAGYLLAFFTQWNPFLF